jgi:hypothetical protein
MYAPNHTATIWDSNFKIMIINSKVHIAHSETNVILVLLLSPPILKGVSMNNKAGLTVPGSE